MRKTTAITIPKILTCLLLFALLCLAGNTGVSAGETGNGAYFLTMGDIHFNPFEKEITAKKLARASVGEWADLLREGEDEYFPGYGEETDFRLFESMLRYAVSIQAIRT